MRVSQLGDRACNWMNMVSGVSTLRKKSRLNINLMLMQLTLTPKLKEGNDNQMAIGKSSRGQDP